MRLQVCLTALALLFAQAAEIRAQGETAIAPAPRPEAPTYVADIAPVFSKHCVSCHSGAEPSGDLVLQFADEAALHRFAQQDPELWGRLCELLSAKEMPPARAKTRPSDEECDRVVAWVKSNVLTVDCTTPQTGRFVIHRLNNREYANTIRDLLYLPADWNAAADFPADERGAGFDNNSDTLTLSPVLIEHYLAAAEKSANFAMDIYGLGSKEAKAKLNLPSSRFKEDFADRQAKVRLNIEVFAPRAYRRPVTQEEIDELMRFASLSFTHDGESFDKATNLALRAALMNPNFLFRREFDPNPDGTGRPFLINEFELASRLSYFLWASMPDDGLFAAAKQDLLRANLPAEVERMLASPQAISLTKDFAGQWLEIRGLEETPNCPPELLRAMKRETEEFFNHIVRENLSIMEFLDADYTFLNETLAALYGISGVTGDEFRKVPVDVERRGGIFTQASFLTLTSKPLEVKGKPATRRPSPVNRGKWILENIFNAEIPPPPPDVPALEIDDGVELVGTVRQIFEQHRSAPKCADCHVRLDPYGFALENYDGFGKWRDQDNSVRVDASGEVGGQPFTTPREFRTLLAGRKNEFRRALVEKLLSYALGRGLEEFDRCAVDKICGEVAEEGDRFRSVILAIVRSDPFQYSRGSRTASAAEVEEPPRAGGR